MTPRMSNPLIALKRLAALPDSDPGASLSSAEDGGISVVPRLSDLRDQDEMGVNRFDAWPVRSFNSRSASDSKAILPLVRSPRTPCRPDPAAERIDLCQRSDRRAFRCAPAERSGCRALEHLCGSRRHPVLPAAERPVAQPVLLAGGDRGQGCGRAKSPSGEAREGISGGVSKRRRSSLSAGAWPAGGLALAVSRERFRRCCCSGNLWDLSLSLVSWHCSA